MLMLVVGSFGGELVFLFYLVYIGYFLVFLRVEWFIYGRNNLNLFLSMIIKYWMLWL